MNLPPRITPRQGIENGDEFNVPVAAKAAAVNFAADHRQGREQAAGAVARVIVSWKRGWRSSQRLMARVLGVP